MAVSNRHILQQGAVVRALGKIALHSLKHRMDGRRTEEPPTPGPEFRRTIRPLPPGLLADYARHVGGDPKAYRGEVPPHLFPQWALPLAARTLERLPYPMVRVVNAGCRMQVDRPLPAGVALEARARLVGLNNDGRRVILHQHVVTGTKEHEDCLVTDLHAILPLNGEDGRAKAGERRPKPRVPADVREIARFRLGADTGLSFAKLTGDFNPIHWLPIYARASGLPSVILHGFATFARAAEGLNQNLFAGDVHRLRSMDARFTRLLVLPADVGLYVRNAEVFVGDAPGGPAYMVGCFETGA